VNFKKLVNNELPTITDIKENLANIDIINTFIDHCRKYFSKPRKNNNYHNMKEYIKREIGSEMTLSEQFQVDGEGKYLCSIFLNGNLLLQQGCVNNYDKNDPKKSMESTIKEFFNSYSVIYYVIGLPNGNSFIILSVTNIYSHMFNIQPTI